MLLAPQASYNKKHVRVNLCCVKRIHALAKRNRQIGTER